MSNKNLEREFKAVVIETQKEIHKILNEAYDKAIKLAKKKGVSFPHPRVYGLQFVVKVPEKYKNLDSEFLQEVQDVWSDYGDPFEYANGWSPSSVCYQ